MKCITNIYITSVDFALKSEYDIVELFIISTRGTEIALVSASCDISALYFSNVAESIICINIREKAGYHHHS